MSSAFPAEQTENRAGEASQAAPPAITLPKGGGAIRGMGEKSAMMAPRS